MKVVSFPKQLMRKLSKSFKQEREVGRRSLDRWDSGARVGRGGWETLWQHRLKGKRKSWEKVVLVKEKWEIQENPEIRT